MKSKIIAITTVLLLALTSMFVLTNNDVLGEGNESETIYLDDILNANTHWAKGVMKEKEPGIDVFVISNTKVEVTGESTLVLNAKPGSNALPGFDHIEFDLENGFKVPANCTIENGGRNMVFENLTIDGAFTNPRTESGKMVSTGDPTLTLNNGKFSAVHIVTEKLNIIVNGESEFSGEQAIFFTDELTVTVSEGGTLASNYIVAQGTNYPSSWTFSIPSCYYSGNEGMPGTLKFKVGTETDNGNDKITLNGIMRQKSSGPFAPYLNCESDRIVDFEFDNFHPLCNGNILIFDNSGFTVTINDDTGIADYPEDFLFVIMSDGFDADTQIKSKSGNVYVTMTAIVNIEDEPIKKIYNENGATDLVAVKLTPATGIASIDTEKPLLICSIGGNVDLSAIEVTYESGYESVKWYYLDENDEKQYISDPEHYVVEDFVTLYAEASKKPGPGPGPGPTPDPPVPTDDGSSWISAPIVAIWVIISIAFVCMLCSMGPKR